MITDIIARIESLEHPTEDLGREILLAAGYRKQDFTNHSMWFGPKLHHVFDDKDLFHHNPARLFDVAIRFKPHNWRIAALCERDPWFCRLETRDFKSVTWGKGEDWITDIVSGYEVSATGATAALAISAASLKAMLVEEVNNDIH